jgi:hypothetical protein
LNKPTCRVMNEGPNATICHQGSSANTEVKATGKLAKAVGAFGSREFVVKAEGDEATAVVVAEHGYVEASGKMSRAFAIGGGTVTVSQKGQSGLAASLGDKGTAMADEKGCILISYWVNSEERYRVAVGYVGENGILPNVRYKVNEAGQLEPAEMGYGKNYG